MINWFTKALNIASNGASAIFPHSAHRIKCEWDEEREKIKKCFRVVICWLWRLYFHLFTFATYNRPQSNIAEELQQYSTMIVRVDACIINVFDYMKITDFSRAGSLDSSSFIIFLSFSLTHSHTHKHSLLI